MRASGFSALTAFLNSSRKILLAYKKENREMEFALCAREEAIKMRDEINKAVKSI